VLDLPEVHIRIVPLCALKERITRLPPGAGHPKPGMGTTSAEAECRLLLSEDLQEGFTWRGVTVTNPFARTLHPILAALLTALQE
jgi:hypothetical protein